MEKDNKDLADLLGHSQRMEAMIIPKSATVAKRYERIGDQARSLYNILKQSLTWPCGCSIPHNASLRLEARSSRGPAPIREEYSDLCFNVLFFFDTDQSMPQNIPPWNWRETKIEATNDTNPHQISMENEPSFKETQIQDATSFTTAKNKITSISAMAVPLNSSFTVDSVDIQSVIPCPA